MGTKQQQKNNQPTKQKKTRRICSLSTFVVSYGQANEACRQNGRNV